MSVKAFIICLFMTGIAVSGLGLSTSGRGVIDFHNAKIIYDWDGVYTGIIPAADGPGIDVNLKLNRDQTFELSYKYLDRFNSPFIRSGKFKWNKTGNIITLKLTDAPFYYKVAENKVIQLDMNKKRITGKLAGNYILKKKVEKEVSANAPAAVTDAPEYPK